MFRQIAAGCMALFLLGGCIVPTYAQQAVPQVLLLSDEPQSEEAAAIAQILTLMGKHTAYSTPEDSKGQLGSYSYIVYHHTKEASSTAFLQELATFGGKLFVVGAGEMAAIVEALGEGAAFEFVGEANWQLRYTFAGQTKAQSWSEWATATLALAPLEFGHNGNVQAPDVSAPLCLRGERLWNLGLFSAQSKPLREVLASELTRWFWPYADEPPLYGRYFVLENFYPFLSTQHLWQAVLGLEEGGIPYVLLLPPLTQNLEFPTTQRYFDILRYAQAKGAGLVLQVPAQGNFTEFEPLLVAVEQSFTAYSGRGVYPTGLQVPAAWLNDKDGMALARLSRTLLLGEDVWQSIEGQTQNTAVLDGHQMVQIGTAGSVLSGSYSTAVLFDATQPWSQLGQQIEQAAQSPLPVQDFGELEQSVYLAEMHVSKRGAGVFVGESPVSTAYVPTEVPQDFAYERNVWNRLQNRFQQENRGLLAVVAGVGILFALCIWLARFHIRKSFWRKKP